MKVSVKHTHKKDAHNHIIRFSSVKNFNEFMQSIEAYADFKFPHRDSEHYKKLVDTIKDNIVNDTSISISEDDFCILFAFMTHMAVYELPEYMVYQERMKDTAMKTAKKAKQLVKLYEKQIYGYSKTFK